MKALIFHGPGRISVEDVPEPVPAPGGLVLRVQAAAICYSDIRVYRGEKKARAGVVPGHEMAGLVHRLGEGVQRFAEGQPVVVCPIIACGGCDFCLRGLRHRCPERVTLGYEEDGGLAEYMLVPRRLLELGHLLPVPRDLSMETAALTEPLACVLNSLEACRLRAGDSLLIVGGGPMGLMHLALARLLGAATVLVSEPDGERAAWARRLGADLVLDPARDDVVGRAREATGGWGADAAVVTAGLPEVLPLALAAVRRQGVVNLFGGFPPGTLTALDPNVIHYGELVLTGSQNASVDQYRRALLLLPRLPQLDDTVTDRFPMAQATGAYEVRLAGHGLKSMVLPQE